MSVPGTGKPTDSKSLRVAMVTRYPPNGTTHSGRGIGPYTKQLAEAIAQTGAEVVIMADRQNESTSTYVEGGVAVCRVWREGLASVRDVERELGSGAFSVIHLQHELFAFGRRGGAIAAARLLHRLRKGFPIVTTIHGVIPRTAFNHQFTQSYAGAIPPRVVETMYSLIMKRIIQDSDLVIVHNDEVLNSLRAYGKVNRSLVVPHGIGPPVARLARNEALQQLGLPEARRAVFLGFLLPYKGVETLEAAIPELSQNRIEVLIAGGESGDIHPTHTNAKRATAGSGIRMGFVPERLLPALFAVTDVLVLPHTVGLSMSGPLSLAAAYDVPVAVSDVPTLASALRCPEATFRAGDPADLAAVVRRVMDNPMIRATVHTRLAEMRAEAAWPIVAREHLSAYRDLLAHSLKDSQARAGLSRDGLASSPGGHR